MTMKSLLSTVSLALLIGSIGSVGMWSVVVVLPVVQSEFGATRGAVSLAFTLTMLGFGLGGVATGKVTDRFGIVAAMALSISFLGLAYVLAGLSTTLWQFIAVHVLIGLGTSATFGPLSPEPLAFLLPAHRGEYRFTSVRDGKEKGRAAFVIDFISGNRKSRPERLIFSATPPCHPPVSLGRYRRFIRTSKRRARG